MFKEIIKYFYIDLNVTSIGHVDFENHPQMWHLLQMRWLEIYA